MISRALRRWACCVVALAAVPTLAQAQQQAAQVEDGEDERRAAYLRFFTGVGVTGDSDLRIRQPALGTDLTFERVSWEHKSLSTDWTKDSIPYVGARVGFFFREPSWLGLSFEVLHFKVFAEDDEPLRVAGIDEGIPIDNVAPMSDFVQRYQVSNGVNMVLVNVQAHKGFGRSARFREGRADVYVGVGGGVTVPYTRSLIDGESRAQYEWGRPAMQLLGGVAWRVSPAWDLSLEYKLTRTTVDGEVAHGDSESILNTKHLAFGFGYHFG